MLIMKAVQKNWSKYDPDGVGIIENEEAFKFVSDVIYELKSQQLDIGELEFYEKFGAGSKN